MRMRRKPNLIPRMARAAEFLAERPEALRGRWREVYADYDAVYAELGCGKGRFTCEMAKINPGTLFIGVERAPDALVVALERAMAEEIKNARFILGDAAALPDYFSHGEAARLYINFCDPWPGSKRVRRRLTSDGFLEIYRQILPKGGEVRFRTDNSELFEYSVKSFVRCGFTLHGITRDLHGADGDAEQDADEIAVMTNYEERFHSLGIKINRLVAVNLDSRS